MRKFFLSMALNALRDYIEEYLTVARVDGLIDDSIEVVRAKLADWLSDYPDLAAAISAVLEKAKEGEEVATMIVNAIDEILSNALTVSTGYHFQGNAYDVRLNGVADSLLKLRSEMTCDDGDCCV